RSLRAGYRRWWADLGLVRVAPRARATAPDLDVRSIGGHCAAIVRYGVADYNERGAMDARCQCSAARAFELPAEWLLCRFARAEWPRVCLGRPRPDVARFASAAATAGS